MSQHSSQSWPQWEEDTFLPWLDAYWELSWEACAEAYYEELGIRGRVDSIRGKNTTSSKNDVSVVQRRQRRARIRSGNDAFDGLEDPERASHHFRKPRMIISTSGFKESRRKGRSLRQANLPQKKLTPSTLHPPLIIPRRKSFSPGLGSGTMCIASVQPKCSSLNDSKDLGLMQFQTKGWYLVRKESGPGSIDVAAVFLSGTSARCRSELSAVKTRAKLHDQRVPFADLDTDSYLDMMYT
ncbi:uncharacterized protein N7469_002177 [Penicillium citrinum]|uniref:Uncharacterized protein n=1 Tax=Penicillium citrinum TaxID=5077 RepID=A0A9W9P9T7_PENCI|nr:uncharacterized protein N7469_002177 [Penicillium citrinum]KAJ5240586.1 hypothetical protein N7469_002177 [Penicillium citrinum]